MTPSASRTTSPIAPSSRRSSWPSVSVVRLARGRGWRGQDGLAKVLAAVLGTRLIRLQCYEGLDVSTAVYEWNYPRQMLEIRLLEAQGKLDDARARDIFTEGFLLRRPLLQALDATDGLAPGSSPMRSIAPTRSSRPSCSSCSPTSRSPSGDRHGCAERPPRVILTSNRTREVHDALKRRCLVSLDRLSGCGARVRDRAGTCADTPERLATAIVAFVQRLRQGQLTKVPGVAETIDWAAALLALGAARLTPELIDDTLGVVLKYEE